MKKENQSEIVKKLNAAALANRGTDLGGLLQWAALHIESQEAALSENHEKLDAAASIIDGMENAMKSATESLDDVSRNIRNSIPPDFDGLFGRDYVSHINIMAGHGDPDYILKNGKSVRHVDMRSKKPKAA